ncbi:unnamed protein product [Leptidea sinapis]|uniref:GPI inositol-deacylase n=1 Tax=Leptidea sinapis TaxID=189913 RepID=A0A5E4QS65_9NEOP|nr:unnamed protein product [Leptidea sinapis]
MNNLKFLGTSVFQLLSLIFVALYFLGIFNMNFSDRNNYCAMTYMFEYPQFVRISLPENKQYPQYGLYAYSEGRFTEKARKMWFDGIPVLFLPGNSGSHMQARSIASVALRKAISNGYEYHFDYFTINFNEELSGLYGGVLQSQTEFAAACISKVLSLYRNHRYSKIVPSSVVLIGHSMGGVIAKRLLAYPNTLNTTSILLTLSAPIEAPVVNFDSDINNYYKLMQLEWDAYIYPYKDVRESKLLISLGGGPRDVLVPGSLTTSNNSYINAMATAIPGVWVSPDHVSMVWCKQLVMVINRYLFDIVDHKTEQITYNKELRRHKAEMYFQANRSMTLNENIHRVEVNMIADAFWYEDNRRVYQIARPEIDRTTYLMIRLAPFPQNRFVAVEAINVDDKDWIFGCNAKDVHSSYRYCKTATSLSELSRWTGAANEFGRRKLATINLHSVQEMRPDWTHVIVKVSPTRKPITLNVDINDYASRQIKVEVPSALSFSKHIIKETESNALYYELILSNFNVIHQAYLLYVEPTSTCHNINYHVSAEMHVPWARNNEFYHYYTHLKQSPMKLRLFISNPNVSQGLDPEENVKITLLLDPKCTFTISISSSWYIRLAQLVRNYTPVLVPYIASIVLLAARSNLLSLKENGSCISIHSALMSEGIKPYYVLVFSRLTIMGLMAIPILHILLENSGWRNLEIQYFTRSLLVLPTYMTALGFLNVIAAVTVAVMIFSSQLAHRLLFRILWRGGGSLAEKVASGLQKIPMIVSASLVCAVPLSCGAAALVAGAAFYAFMLSKMYEEYLEDYVYKLMAKVASKICRIFKRKVNSNSQATQLQINEVKSTSESEINDDNELSSDIKNLNENNEEIVKDNYSAPIKQSDGQDECATHVDDSEIDEDLNNLNFHMMLFFLWMCVTLANVPALLTWARNFKYSMVLKPDTSYHAGFIMSICSGVIWQLNGPRKKLRHYESVCSLLFTMAVFILSVGPFSLAIVNYGVTLMFSIITMQQVCDKEEEVATESVEKPDLVSQSKENLNVPNTEKTNDEIKDNSCKSNMCKGDNNMEQPGDDCDGCNVSKDNKDESNNEETNEKIKENLSKTNDECNSANVNNEDQSSKDCDVCNESRIFNIFSRLRDKFSYLND